MDAGTAPPDPDLGMTDGDAGMPDAGPLPEPILALGGASFTPEGANSYIAIIPSLDAGTEVDLADALEIPGLGFFDAPGDSNRFYVIPPENPIIQRYVVTDEGEIVFDDEVGLSGFGITTISARNPIQFISPTRAYVVDVASL